MRALDIGVLCSDQLRLLLKVMREFMSGHRAGRQPGAR